MKDVLHKPAPGQRLLLLDSRLGIEDQVLRLWKGCAGEALDDAGKLPDGTEGLPALEATRPAALSFDDLGKAGGGGLSALPLQPDEQGARKVDVAPELRGAHQRPAWRRALLRPLHWLVSVMRGVAGSDGRDEVSPGAPAVESPADGRPRREAPEALRVLEHLNSILGRDGAGKTMTSAELRHEIETIPGSMKEFFGSDAAGENRDEEAPPGP